jgi:hypothetical protein
VNPQMFFDTFFELFSLDDLIKRIQNEISRELKHSKGNLSLALVDSLQRNCRDVKTDLMSATQKDPDANGEITTKYFVCDANWVPLGVTQEAVIAFLLQRKVLVEGI